MNMSSPYWVERRLEELWHLQHIANRRRDPDALARLARINTEVSRLPKGVGKMRLAPHIPHREG